MAITLSNNAVDHIKKSLNKRGHGIGLRISIELRGCSGYAYVTDFADEIFPDDEKFEQDGATVVVDKKHLALIDGTHMDYVHKGINWQWEFSNPKAESHCGCGESFNLKED